MVIFFISAQIVLDDAGNEIPRNQSMLYAYKPLSLTQLKSSYHDLIWNSFSSLSFSWNLKMNYA